MGRKTHVNLCEKVKTLRNQQVLKELENTMLEGYQDQERGEKKQKRRDSEVFIKEVDLQSTADQDSELYKMLYTAV